MEVTGVGSGNVYGTDIYNIDSNIGMAAVHAGKLSIGETKTLKIQVLPSMSGYTLSTRNGVTTRSATGTAVASYRFID